MKRLSISQRLRRAKTIEVRREIVHDWIKNWESDQAEIVRSLGKAVKDRDFDLQCQLVGELKAVTEKRFLAFPNVVDLLISEKEENDE